jgi:hypothetical protein
MVMIFGKHTTIHHGQWNATLEQLIDAVVTLFLFLSAGIRTSVFLFHHQLLLPHQQFSSPCSL